MALSQYTMDTKQLDTTHPPGQVDCWSESDEGALLLIEQVSGHSNH